MEITCLNLLSILCFLQNLFGYTVPREALPKLISGIRNIAANFVFQVLCFGHAGNENPHTNITKGEMKDAEWNHHLKNVVEKIFFRRNNF
ncbi:FAD-linked oxidase C-terminal domain-containing protein [Pedobacter sp. AW1-32]|uniref:FAD-linked oxidase C-terminal domain-containing protein n=1 Tax=Pedobacter sp. AW1-32 TaxID=3383026 RepID=UPI003FEE83D1